MTRTNVPPLEHYVKQVQAEFDSMDAEKKARRASKRASQKETIARKVDALGTVGRAGHMAYNTVAIPLGAAHKHVGTYGVLGGLGGYFLLGGVPGGVFGTIVGSQAKRLWNYGSKILEARKKDLKDAKAYRKIVDEPDGRREMPSPVEDAVSGVDGNAEGTNDGEGRPYEGGSRPYARPPVRSLSDSGREI